MTLVPVICPYCDHDLAVILEVGETNDYICEYCKKKFTATSNIIIRSD